jgi:hypothetical protein
MKALSISKQFICSVLLMGFIIATTISCGQTSKKVVSGDAAIKIANDAFTYGLPLVLMDITRRQLTNHEIATQIGAPMNQLSNKQGFPTPADTGVVAPNVDTYYSIAWGDVSKEPIVFFMPPTNSRYYVMPFLDAFTNVFASPGTRTGNTLGDTFLISQPKWNDQLPQGIKKENHFKCETGFFWLLGRIKCDSKVDGDTAVIPIQNSMKFMPLSNWKSGEKQKPRKPESNVPTGSPNDIAQNMPIDSFFNYLNRLLVDNPPTAADAHAMEAFATIGVGPGKTFNLAEFDATTQTAMQSVPESMFNYYNNLASQSNSLTPQGWSVKTSGMGTYGTDYLQRAVVAVKGLGANLPQDAIYPSTFVDSLGNPYMSNNNYQITFDKDSLPKNYVGGFWSLTMYNSKGYLVSNKDSIYAVGHGPKFKYNKDGSLTILIQNTPPTDVDMRHNWLPSPPSGDNFNLMMRLYWPNNSVLQEQWLPPAVKITGPAVASKKK